MILCTTKTTSTSVLLPALLSVVITGILLLLPSLASADSLVTVLSRPIDAAPTLRCRASQRTRYRASVRIARASDGAVIKRLRLTLRGNRTIRRRIPGLPFRSESLLIWLTTRAPTSVRCTINQGSIEHTLVDLGVSSTPSTDSQSAYLTNGCEQADINGDSLVDGRDLSVLLAQLGAGGTFGDINADGVVNGLDLSVLLHCMNPSQSSSSGSSSSAMSSSSSSSSCAVPSPTLRHIRADGNDAASGANWSEAWRTLPSTLEPGTTYLIASGDYPRYRFDDAGGDATVVVRKATTANHGNCTGWSSSYQDGPVRFDGLEFHNATNVLLDGAEKGGILVEGSSGVVVSIDDSRNVTLRRIEVSGRFHYTNDQNTQGIGACTGVRIRNGHQISLSENIIHSLADDGMEVSSVHELDLFGNEISHLYGCGTGTGCSPCINGHSDGLELANIQGARIDSNFIFDVRSNAALFFSNWGAPISTNISLSNNIFYTPLSGFVAYLHYVSNIKLYNNVLWQGTYGGVAVGPHTSGLQIVNNIVHSINYQHSAYWNPSETPYDPTQHRISHNVVGTLEGSGSWTPELSNIVTRNPQFRTIPELDGLILINVWRDWFRLRSGSPAVDSGLDEFNTPEFDMCGGARVDIPEVPNSGAGVVSYVDRGALEQLPDSGSTSSQSSSESSLSISSQSSSTHSASSMSVTSSSTSSTSSSSQAAPPGLTQGLGFEGETQEPAPNCTIGIGCSARPAAHWDVVPFQTVNDTFDIGVVAFHINGIARVSFSLSSGPWVDVFAPSVNNRTGVREYVVRLDASVLPDGPKELRAIVYPTQGTPRVLESLTISTNFHRSLPTLERFISPSGDDTTGTGTQENPFRTILRAARSIQDSTGSADGGIINLLPGSYSYGAEPGSEFPWYNQVSTLNRWLVLRPAPGVTQSEVVLNRAHSDGLKTKLIKLEGLTIRSQGGSALTDSGAFPAAFWLDRVRMVGPGRDIDMSWEGYAWTAGKYLTNSHISDARGGIEGARLQRGVLVEHIGSDAFSNSSAVINCEARDVRAPSQNFHPDVYQFYRTRSNVVLYGVKADSDIDSQGIFIKDSNIVDVAIVDCDIDVWANDGAQPQPGIAMQVDFTPTTSVSHLYIKNSSFIGPASWDPRVPTSNSVIEQSSFFSRLDSEGFPILGPDWEVPGLQYR